MFSIDSNFIAYCILYFVDQMLPS